MRAVRSIALVLSLGACGGTAAAPADPPTSAAPEPVVPPLEVSVGFGICVRTGGEVWCRDQPGAATRGVFARVADIDDAVAIDTGADATCVVHASGAVSCWGTIGQGHVTSPTRVADVEDASTVAVGDLDACARTRTGAVLCWGRTDGAWRGAPVSALDGVVELVAAGHHVCARRDDGTVWCWGDDDLGALGRDGHFGTTPLAIDGVADAIAIDTDRLHGCALAQSGRVTCWGGRAPASFDVPDGVSIGVGARHVCVLRRAGGVHCTGDETHGELGDGRDTATAVSVDVVGLSGATALSVSEGTSCALAGDAISCWGAMPDPTMTLPAFRPVPRPLAGIARLGHATASTGLAVERTPSAELPVHADGGDDALRVRGASVHDAARFVATVRHANVIVVADAEAPPIDVTLGPGTAEAALRAIAAAASLGVERWGSGARAIYVVASAERLAQARDTPASVLPTSRTQLDLDHARVSGAALFASLGEVAGWHVSGSLDGVVTVLARDVTGGDVASAVLRLAGATASASGRDVTVIGGALAPGEAQVHTECDEQSCTATYLPCTSPWRLWLGATAIEHGQARALLVGDDRAEVVQRGDFVSRAEISLAERAPEMLVSTSWRVHEAGPEGVVLTEENATDPSSSYVRRLTLGEPPTAPGSLDGF